MLLSELCQPLDGRIFSVFERGQLQLRAPSNTEDREEEEGESFDQLAVKTKNKAKEGPWTQTLGPEVSKKYQTEPWALQ